MFNPDDKWSADMRSASVNRAGDKSSADRRIARREDGQPREKFKNVLNATSKNESETEVGKEVESEEELKQKLSKAHSGFTSETELPSTSKKEQKPVAAPAQLSDIFNLSSHASKKGERSVRAAKAYPLNPMKEIEPVVGASHDIFSLGATSKVKTPLLGSLEETLTVVQDSQDIFTDPKATEKAGALMQISIHPGIETRLMDQVNQVSPSLRTQELRTVVEQLAKSIVIQHMKGEMDTVVTVRGSPLFNGATIRITQTEFAPKEFNLTFGNLSTDALRLMQLKQTQDGLQQALAEKGYTVHMMTMRHDPDERIISYQESEPSRERDPQDQQREEEQNS